MTLAHVHRDGLYQHACSTVYNTTNWSVEMNNLRELGSPLRSSSPDEFGCIRAIPFAHCNKVRPQVPPRRSALQPTSLRLLRAAQQLYQVRWAYMP
eukprot:6173845-Pleurochrysis_carterae.AAC.2